MWHRLFKSTNAQCADWVVSFPSKLRHILKFVPWYIIQHIFVPACSVGRKTWFSRKLLFSNSKFGIFGSFWPILSVPKIMLLVLENESSTSFKVFLLKQYSLKTQTSKKPQNYCFPMRKCFYGYSHLTTGPSYYPKRQCAMKAGPAVSRRDRKPNPPSLTGCRTTQSWKLRLDLPSTGIGKTQFHVLLVALLGMERPVADSKIFQSCSSNHSATGSTTEG